MFKILSNMPHVVFGVWGIMAAVWLLVEVLNVNEKNLKRIKISAYLSTIFTWLAYIIGGWWYVFLYAADKAVIKGSSWAWAHGIVMETKEHVFLLLVMLSLFLPLFVSKSNLLEDKGARKIIITLAILCIALGFGMELFGSLITKGLKAGLIGGI